MDKVLRIFISEVFVDVIPVVEVVEFYEVLFLIVFEDEDVGSGDVYAFEVL